MKKSMSVCKRLLAMLLVFAMVIGYIPGLSFATDSAAEQIPEIIGAKVVTPFLVTVTRSEYKEAAPEESAAASDEVPGEEPVETEAAYTYTAVLTVADQIVAEADVKFAWVYGDNGENIVEGACAENISGQYKEIGLECTYDGITLTEKLEEADFAETAEVKIPLSAEMKLGEAKLGAPAAAPAAASSQNFVGQWTVANWNETYVVDGYVLNGADAPVRLATLQLRGEAAEGEEPVVYLEQEWMVKIVPVQFSASLEVEEGKREWYNTVNAVVTITGDAPVKDSSFIKETVLVDGMEFAANWTTKDEGKTWQSAKITLTETGNHSIAACNTKFEFDIDTVRPTVQIEGAYYTTVGGVQITVLDFSYTVGKSGLEKITIYDGDKIVVDNFNPNAPGSILVGWIENPRVVVLGRNGLSSEVNPVPQGALTVTVEGPAEDTVLGTIGDEIYAPAGEVTVVVEGAAEAGAYMLDIEKSVITAKDQSGNDIQVGKWSYANGKWTAAVTLAGGLSELSASVVDGKNRKAECSFDQKYAVDTEAPVVTVSRDVDPVNTMGEAGTADYVEYYNHDVTYTFTISDLLLGDAENYVTYQIDGREPVQVSFVDGVASVKVVNGQRLTGLTVCGVDASGNVTRNVVVAEGSALANTWTENTGLTYACNAVVDTEAPVVSAVASGNVQAFYTAADGRVYAVLKNNTPKVTLTVTVKDKNLNAGCLTAEGAAWEISFNEEEGLYEAVAAFQVEVPENATDVLKYAFTIRDLANWSYDSDLTLNVNKTTTVGLVSGTVLTRNENGGFEGELHVDRRKPSTSDVEVPVIELVPSIEPTVSANGNDLFSGAFEFTMDVSDTTNGNTDSGIRYVEWTITDDNGVVAKGSFDDFNTETNLDGVYKIPVNLNVAEGESNEVRLQIWVKDHALNNIGYAKVFGVDTKAPEIEAAFDKNLEETEFYDGERTLNVTAKDLNLKNAKLYINGELAQELTAEADTIAFVPVTFDKGGVYNIKIEAVDLAGNAKTVELPEFIVDMTPPEVQVTKTVEEGKGRFQSIAGVDYYNGKVTYTVTVADQFLDAASGVATLTYTFEDGTTNTVALGDANGWTLDEEKGTYSCSFAVENGQVLTGMTLQVVDNAGNSMTAVSGTEPFTGKDGIWSYNGYDVVVDQTAPEITVTKDNNEFHTYQDRDYYGKDVTYTIQVTDNFLNERISGALSVMAVYTDGTVDSIVLDKFAVETTEDEKHAAPDHFIGDLTVNANKVLETIKINIKDNAGNAAAFSGAEAAEFEQAADGIWFYNGNPIVVDKTAPKAEISFSENVDSFYMKDGTIYAVLNDAVKNDENGNISGAETEKVTVTIQVTDKNLAIDNEYTYGVKAGTFGWSGEPGVNTESTITYIAESADVAVDGTAVFEIDATVIDLAGNLLVKEGVTVNAVDNANGLGEIVPVIPGLGEGEELTEGKIAFTVNVDRRRPTSDETLDMAVINVVPSIEATKTASGLDLYNGAFSFDLHVEDKNSGVNFIAWNLVDANGFVSTAPVELTAENLNAEGNYTIPVALSAEVGESNDAVLTVTAKDYVGNTIVFQYKFGVDTQDPSITQSYTYGDEMAVPTNGKFYNKDLTVNVTARDLNLSNAKLIINGNVVQEWNEMNDTAATLSYTITETGVYTIKIEATDLAGNNQPVDLPDIVVDLDAPEVEVTKSADAFRTVDGVDYYNDEVTYTVTVADQFLSAASGVATLTYTFEDGTTETVQLGAESGWVKDAEKDTYTYSFTVTDGKVLTGMTLQVVDNAGNPMTAVSGIEFVKDENGTWSYNGNDVVVDQTAPVINVTKDKESVHTYKNHDYYVEDVTYTIQVTDNFLNANVTDTLSAVAVFTDGTTTPIGLTKTVQEPAEGETALAEKHADLDTYTGSIKLDDAKVLKTIEIRVKDNSGNIAVFPEAAAAEFKQAEDGTWAYTGDSVVVDNTAPTAEIRFSKEVDSFYMKADGTIYAVLKTPVNLNSGETAQDKQHVEVTIQVTDHNLAIDNEDTFGVKAGTFGWTGEPAVNTESTITYTAKSEEVAVDGTAVFKIDVQIVDLAGNFLVKEGVKPEGAPNNNGLGKTVPAIPGLGEGEELTEGKIAFTVNVDRRRPTSGDADEVPVIIIDDSINPTKTADGLPLYNGAFSFDLYVEDKDSGINYLKWNLKDGNDFVKENTADLSGDALNADGKYNIPVELPAEASESNEVVLTIESMDNVGNIIKYEYDFGVDTLAPRIEYAYTYGEAKAEPTNVNFYNKDVTLTVSITDLNLDENYNPESFINIIRYSAMPKKGAVEQPVDSTWNPAELSYQRVGDTITYTFPMTFVEDGIYGVTTDVQDLANYKSDEQAIDNVFILDKTAPAVHVAKTVKEGKSLVRTVDGVDYHDGEVTYTVTIADQFLSAEPGQVNVAVLTYTFEDGTTETVQLGEDTKWTAFQYLDGKTYYQYEFTVTDGKVLTDMTLQAVDNANNPMTEVLGDAPFADEDKDGIWTYTGNDVVVDKTAPVVTVTMEQTPAHTYTIGEVARDYYDEKVIYTIAVKDSFMNEGVAQYYKVTYSIMDDQGNITTETKLMTAKPGEGLMVTEDTFEFQITIEDGQVLEALEFQVEDNSGNIADFAKAADYQFEQFKAAEDAAEDEMARDGAWVYMGNPIVVDLTAPAAELKFSDNVDAFYTNGNTVYVILKEPVVGNSGVASTQKAQTVTMTLTVTDKNLAIDNDEKYNGVKDRTADDFKWVGETAVNKESTITYTAQSVDVAADGRQTFEIDLQIIDLVGHAPKLVRISTGNEAPALGGNVPDVDVDENGNLKFTVSSDRLRPTSKDDQTAPTIVINPSIEPTTTASGLDLFNGAFTFAMTVTDGKADPRNSGIREVVWTVEDKNGVVAGYETVDTFDNYTMAKDYTINIPLAVAKGESNDVKLTITAMDNVGNTIVYEKTFGVDNLAPRVTITQSNHDVQNDFYFKADQVITVTIEDLNFEPTTSSVTTEVSFNGWQDLGENKYRTVLTYNRDGDYTFAMATKDRANNDAVIDYTTGLTALQKFTIDKTAPIINVTFNPAVAVDRDPAGVQYFDKDRSVTATITEHNFRASDVRSDLGARNSLSAWRSNGDTHTAGELFTEGNNYKVSIQYTDLAGNPAESYTSPTFSVDTGNPTITIIGGMSEGKLNIVPGDLNLDFTINDEESNLKSLDVEVIFLDRNFNQTKVEGAEYYTLVDENSRTTRYINFANIEAIKANDGIYTVRVTAVDYAGHVVTLMSDLVFSLNRFGSTFYAHSDYTKSFLTTDEEGTIYRSDVEKDLVIKEINPNRVWQDADKKEEGSLITVSVNGKAKALKEGKDYQMDVEEMGLGTGKWFEYTYQISKDVFRNDGELVDGEYTILFYSEDDAANKNTNERNEGSSLTLGSDGSYNGKIVFTLDHKAPVVTILGISNGQNIFEKNQTVEINIADNTTVFVDVYINDQKVEEVKVDVGQPVDSDWLYYDAATGTYKMNMSEKHVPQNISIVVKDAAGNKITEERTDIMLTENLWYQYINSTPAKIATVVIALALFMLIMILIKKRKQKKEAEAAAAKL